MVGRGSSVDLSIVDVRLSREHFRIRHDGSHWIIEDLKSQNGTCVNDEPVLAPQTLAHDDAIVAGDTRFRVILEQRWFWRFHPIGSGQPAKQSSSWLRKLWKR